MLDPSMDVDQTHGADMNMDATAWDQAVPPHDALASEMNMDAVAWDQAVPPHDAMASDVAQDEMPDDICRMRVMDTGHVNSMMMQMQSDIEHASSSIHNVSDLAEVISIAITDIGIFASDVAVDDPDTWFACCMTAFEWIGSFRVRVSSKQPLNTAKLLDRCYAHASKASRRTVCTGLVLALVPDLTTNEARLAMLVDWVMRVEHIADHTMLAIKTEQVLQQIHGKLEFQSIAVFPECNLVAAVYMRIGARFFEPANRKRSLLCPEITAWFALMYTKMPFQTLHDAFLLLPIARNSWATTLLPSVHIMIAACAHADAIALTYDFSHSLDADAAALATSRRLDVDGRLIELVLLVLSRCKTVGMSRKYANLAEHIGRQIWDTTESPAFHQMQARLPVQKFENVAFSAHKREVDMFRDVTPKRWDSLVFLVLECVWSAEHARLNGVYVKIDPRTGNVVNHETTDMHGQPVVAPVKTSYDRLCRLCTMAVQMMMRYYDRRAVTLLLEERAFNASLGAYASKMFPYVHGEFLRAWSAGRISHTELATLTEGAAAIDTDSPIPDICQIMLALDTLANTSPKPAAMIFGRVNAWVGTIDNADVIFGDVMDAFRRKVMDTSDAHVIAELLS